MNGQWLDLFYIVFLFSLVTSIYLCTYSLYIRQKEIIKYVPNKAQYKIRENYFLNISPKDYRTYEKIDIWRYSTLF